MMTRAVLFDLDGTLMDHRRASDEAVVEWAKLEASSDLSSSSAISRWAALERRFFSQYEAGLLSFQEQRRNRIRAFETSLANLSDSEADSAFAAYLKLYESHWRAVDGAAELIDYALTRSWAVGVLTNGDEAQQKRKLAQIELDRADVVLFASSALGAAKPSAAAFHLACQGLGRHPSVCVMVGDDYFKDVVAARNAGLDAIHFASDPRDRRPESELSLHGVMERLSG